MLKLDILRRFSNQNLTDADVKLRLKKTTQYRVILIRHGQTDWNTQNRLQGRTDIPLNTIGKSQAERLATFLQDIRIDCAFCSNLSRAKETASIILQHHHRTKLEVRSALGEIDRGHWQGMTMNEIKMKYPKDFELWCQHPHLLKNSQNYSGETMEIASQRIWKEWKSILTLTHAQPAARNILVVAHEGVNRLILGRITGAKFWQVPQDNAALNAIDYPWGIHAISKVRVKNFVV